MIGNKQSCLEVINAGHMLTETFPCAEPWYRKEAYSKAMSEALFTSFIKLKTRVAYQWNCYPLVTVPVNYIAQGKVQVVKNATNAV